MLCVLPANLGYLACRKPKPFQKALMPFRILLFKQPMPLLHCSIIKPYCPKPRYPFFYANFHRLSPFKYFRHGRDKNKGKV